MARALLLAAVAAACVSSGAWALPTARGAPCLGDLKIAGVEACAGGILGPRGPHAAGGAVRLRPVGPRVGVQSGSGELEALRGGASGLAKKLGGKNLGLLVILLSLLYLPRAMNQCAARVIQGRGGKKGYIQRLGCGSGLSITNVATLSGLAMVLVNSRQFDRHGRSKLKMRMTGAIIMCIGMLLIIAHAEPAQVSWYSKSNAYIGLFLEWWGFVSLFYNFTPKFVAQIPRELGKMFNKATGKKGGAAEWSDADAARQAEVDRLNRWAQAQSPAS